MPNGTHNDRPAGAPPRGTSGETPSVPDTQGDLRASVTAAQAFNKFTSTIEAIVAQLGQAGIAPTSEVGMQTFDETGEALPSVDVHALNNKIEGLDNLVNLMKGSVSKAQETADSAKSIALRALSKAGSSGNSAYDDSVANKPDYIEAY